MIERVRKSDKNGGGGNYFSAPKTNLKFVPSGSKLLDLVLGGGWARGRVANIVGDKSTGKSLLCIEASANFALVEPYGKILYRESEKAFDEDYAAALGMPIDRVDFGKNPLETVEDVFDDLSDCIKKYKQQPTLYFCDSLDALSDEAELDRDFSKGSFGAQKAKDMSKLFRMLISGLSGCDITVIFVSQVRDNIGVMFGEKHKRSGGKALDFYASQVLFLSQIEKLKKKVLNTVRITGVKIRAHCKKNKVALPYREAEFEILFGYGIDDAKACLEWLKELGKENDFLRDSKYSYMLQALRDGKHKKELLLELHEVVQNNWYAIETELLPKHHKYEKSVNP